MKYVVICDLLDVVFWKGEFGDVMVVVFIEVFNGYVGVVCNG